MKMRHSFVLLMAIVCMALSFNACKKGGKNDDDKPTEQPGTIRGMGDNAGTPEGDPYVLPAGIAVVGQIKGDFCDTTYLVGSGQFVSVCVALINNNATDMTVTLPAGLIIVAADEEDQHGIVVQQTRVALKAKKITRVGLGAYCINSSKHPSSSSGVYTFGPVTSSRLMWQLLDKLKNKKVNIDEYPDEDAYLEAESIVQGLIWNLTDGIAGGNYIQFQEMQLPEIPNK